MESLFFLYPTLRADFASIDARKLQCAFFLAQTSTQATSYSFSLMRGRVFSEDLDQELVFLHIRNIAKAAEAMSVSPHADEGMYQRFSSCLSRFLDQETQVVEAAATNRFYEQEGLGNPAAKLRWYNELSPDVRSEATQLDLKSRHAPAW